MSVREGGASEYTLQHFAPGYEPPRLGSEEEGEEPVPQGSLFHRSKCFSVGKGLPKEASLEAFVAYILLYVSAHEMRICKVGRGDCDVPGGFSDEAWASFLNVFRLLMAELKNQPQGFEVVQEVKRLDDAGSKSLVFFETTDGSVILVSKAFETSFEED